MNKLYLSLVLAIILGAASCQKEEVPDDCSGVDNTGDIVELVMNGQSACFLPDVEYMLYVQGSNHTDYLWSTGETTSSINVTEAGHYSVVVVNGVTTDEEYFEVLIRDDCETIYVPNAFTPNNDGINDVFSPVGSNICQYKLWVSDLSGTTLYETESLQDGWNGEFDNRPMNPGIYVWNYEITFVNGEYQDNTGFVELLR